MISHILFFSILLIFSLFLLMGYVQIELDSVYIYIYIYIPLFPFTVRTTIIPASATTTIHGDDVGSQSLFAQSFVVHFSNFETKLVVNGGNTSFVCFYHDLVSIRLR